MRSIEISGALALWKDVLENLLRQFDRHDPGSQRREGDDTGQRALELPDVARDTAGDERQHLGVGDVDAGR